MLGLNFLNYFVINSGLTSNVRAQTQLVFVYENIQKHSRLRIIFLHISSVSNKSLQSVKQKNILNICFTCILCQINQLKILVIGPETKLTKLCPLEWIIKGQASENLAKKQPLAKDEVEQDRIEEKVVDEDEKGQKQKKDAVEEEKIADEDEEVADEDEKRMRVGRIDKEGGKVQFEEEK